jgi:NAD(P)-dependent dehydrogenase (short-subunit alcohol dehydrogenase family)
MSAASKTAPRAVQEVEAELGPVDILVNNAGITRDGFFHKMSHDQWSDVIRVNMDSVFNTTRQVINGMRDRGHGRIVNISSINGQKGQVGQTNYSAAKAGMIGFTKALALENARKGVTVNCIAPAISTPRWSAPWTPRCWNPSWPRSPSAAWARARRSPTWCPGWWASVPDMSQAAHCR